MKKIDDSDIDMAPFGLFFSIIIVLSSIEGIIEKNFVWSFKFIYEYGTAAILINIVLLLGGLSFLYYTYIRVLKNTQRTRVLIVLISLILLVLITTYLMIYSDFRLNFFTGIILLPGLIHVVHLISKNYKFNKE